MARLARPSACGCQAVQREYKRAAIAAQLHGERPHQCVRRAISVANLQCQANHLDDGWTVPHEPYDGKTGLLRWARTLGGAKSPREYCDSLPPWPRAELSKLDRHVVCIAIARRACSR